MAIATINPAAGELLKAFEPFGDSQLADALKQLGGGLHRDPIRGPV
jgi:hypothetical protein